MQHVTSMSALEESTISIPWASHAFERDVAAYCASFNPYDLAR